MSNGDEHDGQTKKDDAQRKGEQNKPFPSPQDNPFETRPIQTNWDKGPNVLFIKRSFNRLMAARSYIQRKRYQGIIDRYEGDKVALAIDMIHYGEHLLTTYNSKEHKGFRWGQRSIQRTIKQLKQELSSLNMKNRYAG